MEPEARNSTSDEVKIPNSLKDGFEAMAGFSLPSETVKLLAESSIKMLLQVEAAKQTESNDANILFHRYIKFTIQILIYLIHSFSISSDSE